MARLMMVDSDESLYSTMRSFTGCSSRNSFVLDCTASVTSAEQNNSCPAGNASEEMDIANPSTNSKEMLPVPPLKDRICKRRHILSGTGRIAFGDGDNVRMIYRSQNEASAGSRIAHAMDASTNRISDNSIDLRAFASLALNDSGSAGSSSDRGPCGSTLDDNSSRSHEPQSENNNPTSENPENGENSRSGTDHGKGSADSRNKATHEASNATTTGISRTARSKPATTGRKGPFLAPGSAPQQNTRFHVGVGTSGRAAAMAKMAALGEEWAEEEELPGMMLPVSQSIRPVSGGGGIGSTVASTGGSRQQQQGSRSSTAVGMMPNAQVRNEVVKAGQRQRKLKSTKK